MLEQSQQLQSWPWQLGPSSSFTQPSKSLKNRLFQLLDVGFYFYTMEAISGRWQRLGTKQTNKAPINKAALSSSQIHSHGGSRSLLPLRRCAFTFVFRLLLFFLSQDPSPRWPWTSSCLLSFPCPNSGGMVDKCDFKMSTNLLVPSLWLFSLFSPGLPGLLDSLHWLWCNMLLYRLLPPELAHSSKEPSVAVGRLGFQEAEPLCFSKGQLSMSETRTSRPRVERRPWTKRGNQIFGKPWPFTDSDTPWRSSSHIEILSMMPIRPLCEHLHCHRAHYSVMGSVLLLDNSKSCIYCQWQSFFPHFWSWIWNNTVNSAVAETILLTLYVSSQ